MAAKGGDPTPIKISALSRQLMIFHLFRFMREVQYKDITDAFPISEKTAYRDIRALKQIGVIHIRYSSQTKSFLPPKGEEWFIPEEFDPPVFPAESAKKRHAVRLLRLCTIMEYLGWDWITDPADWYSEHYPKLSRRTRERDFKLLDQIGYRIFWLSADRLDKDDEFYPQTDEDWDRLEAGKLPEYRRCRFPEDIDEVEAFQLPMTWKEGKK